jgi:hypothetical protein
MFGLLLFDMIPSYSSSDSNDPHSRLLFPEFILP